jgi:hypothetical protein
MEEKMSEDPNETKSVVEKIFDSLFMRLEGDDSFDESTIEKIRLLQDQHILASKSHVEKALKPEEVENEDN